MSWERCAPKIGDTASLWNFTAAPGWTQGDVRVLKLGLMKFGMGQWVKILDTGLLPGKMIQQLNGQTQRLVGQQSLGAFTGLKLDVDRLRKDNDARTDVTRKNGLIINTGAPLTKEAKQQLRNEALAKYGLSKDELEEVDAELKELAEQRTGPMNNSLLDVDATKLDVNGRIALLRELREMLLEMMALWKKRNAGTEKEQNLEEQDLSESKFNNEKEQIPPGGHQTSGKVEEEVGGPTKKQQQVDCDDNDDDDKLRPQVKHSEDNDPPKPLVEVTTSTQRMSTRKRQSSNRGSSRKKCRSTPQQEESVSPGGMDPVMVDFEANLETLTSMGYSKRHAIEALEETGQNVQAAIEWLLVNCL